MSNIYYLTGLLVFVLTLKFESGSGYLYTIRYIWGCYQDEVTANVSVLRYEIPVSNISKLTQGYCSSICFAQNVSYIYSGVENGSQCFCDYEFQERVKISDSYCNDTCPSSTTASCGGYKALDISRLRDMNFTCPDYVYVNQTFNCSVNYVKISQGNQNFTLDFGNGNNSTINLTSTPKYYQNSYSSAGYQNVTLSPFFSNTIFVYGVWSSWGSWEDCDVDKQFYTDASPGSLTELVYSGIACDSIGSNDSISSQINSIATQTAYEVANISQNTQIELENLKIKYKTTNTVASTWGALTIGVVVAVLVVTVLSDFIKFLVYIKSIRRSNKISSKMIVQSKCIPTHGTENENQITPGILIKQTQKMNFKEKRKWHEYSLSSVNQIEYRNRCFRNLQSRKRDTVGQNYFLNLVEPNSNQYWVMSVKISKFILSDTVNVLTGKN